MLINTLFESIVSDNLKTNERNYFRFYFCHSWEQLTFTNGSFDGTECWVGPPQSASRPWTECGPLSQGLDLDQQVHQAAERAAHRGEQGPEWVPGGEAALLPSLLLPFKRRVARNFIAHKRSTVRADAPTEVLRWDSQTWIWWTISTTSHFGHV